MPLKNILLLPYLNNFHWRLIIVNIKEESFTMLDPFEEGSDLDRAFSENDNFIRMCKDGSSFSMLKTIKWKKCLFKTLRPYQSLSDHWSCRVYVVYYTRVV